ncbi:hypothetical protein K469DRAFT_807313 [Zopfia rhizophila CBS 207.26]|uniref:Secreted protein n=1 Tax=Zopfia rhizophila CBS 207.26 TaxID=1314779 RepID=A0A6A6DDN6_9PEZI|nr:hypothetical protein K469DRAFT_807313 [Zopfia rhizophila CBS 207.26]
MKLAAALALAPFIFERAFASLNCTIVEPTVTQRYCEWDGCQPFATAKAGDVIHAGCRADCSDEKEPWFQLYDGSFIRATNLTGCRYHCQPYAVTGLPYCYWERNQTAPAQTKCGASSTSGLESKIQAPKTLGPEPPPFGSIVSKCSLSVAPPTPPPITAPSASKRWAA